MSATLPRSSSARPRAQRLVLALSAALASLAILTPAASADVVVKDVFAMPVDATPFGDDDARNQRILCTPEPSGRFEYLTHDPLDLTRGATTGLRLPGSVDNEGNPNYQPANVPSSANLTPALQAGGSADLCFGFTLTPIMQPLLVRDNASNINGKRINDPAAPLADDPDARIYQDVEPGTGFGGGSRVLIDGDDMREVTVTMPKGFAGTPDDVPACSDEAFGTGKYSFPSATCGRSIVGTAYVRLTTMVHLQNNTTFLPITHLANGGQANPVGGIGGGGQVFNLERSANELARLGIMVAPAQDIAPTKIIIRLTLNASGQIQAIAEAPRRIFYRWDVTDGVPDADAEVVPMYVEALGIRAWGKAADHPTRSTEVGNNAIGRVTYESGLTKDFAQWGTDCSTTLKAGVSIETYQGVRSSGESNGFQLTGCEGLDFRPDIQVATSEQRPGVPTATEVRVSVGQNPEGQQRTALLRTAKVTLPKGLELGAQVASGAEGLRLCSAADFAANATAPASCPQASRAGSVTIATPLLNTDFVGNVYLGEQPAVGELPKLYVEAAPQGATLPMAPRIKLVGSVAANDDGTITTTFEDAPQLRFSEIQLTFPGGDHALFVTPRTCDPATATSTFTSWAGQTVERTSSIQMTQCDAPGFAPTMAMTPSDATAGASAPTAVTISREDRSPWLQDVKVSLPTGFLADLNVPTECSKAAAQAAACPESSRIASVITQAGAGAKPLQLAGAMYLVERDEGAVAGAAIVVRAKLGELDLGDVVVPARIDLRPTDAGLTLTTKAPTRFKNLALLLRSITVNLDRQGFALNPTACGPLRATAEIGADTGAQATPTADVSYTGCAQKGFAPELKTEFLGDVKEGQRPTVRVTMTPRKGDTNLRSVDVLLPEGAAAWTPNINGRQCSNDAFIAGTCSANSRVGSVNATVAITPDRLVGDVYLVSVAGETLPGIGMSFTGRYAQRVLSRVKVDRTTGRLRTAFESIPDLPLTSLELTIDGGTRGPIQFSSEVCKRASTWDAALTGQGGQTRSLKLPLDCGASAAPKATTSARWSRKTGMALTVKAPAGRSLQTVRITLPAGFKINRSKASLRRNMKVKVRGGKATTRVTSRTITVRLRGTKATQVQLSLRPAGYRASTSVQRKTLKKGGRVKLRTSVTLVGAGASANNLTARVR